MRIIITVLKMSLAGLITSLLTKAFGLDYWITAGILAVLSTQLTKRDSINIAIKRISGAVLGLILASLMFVLFGYNYIVFSVFVLVFAGASFLLSIEIGIVPVLVLVSHLLEKGSFSWTSVLNEFLIIAIAIVVVLILDLVYPSPAEKQFKKYIDKIDQQLKEHLIIIAQFLRNEIGKEETIKHYDESLLLFKETQKEAVLLDKDLLFQKGSQYLSYLDMRKDQITHINHIYKHALKLLFNHEHVLKVANFIEELVDDISYYDKATSQLEKLLTVREFYKTTTLPKTREEFETRAMIYQMLNEIEYLLEAKTEFHKNNPKFGFLK